MSDEVIITEEVVVEEVVVPPIDMPIVFLAPKELEGRTGYQRVDGTKHSVIGIFFDDGTEVTQGCSYKSQWQAEQDIMNV